VAYLQSVHGSVPDRSYETLAAKQNGPAPDQNAVMAAVVVACVTQSLPSWAQSAEPIDSKTTRGR
jgi:hypothetical protein